MRASTVRSTVYFEQDIYRALHLKATSTDCSISELVNRAVCLLLNEDGDDLAAFEDRAAETVLSYDELRKDLEGYGSR